MINSPEKREHRLPRLSGEQINAIQERFTVRTNAVHSIQTAMTRQFRQNTEVAPEVNTVIDRPPRRYQPNPTNQVPVHPPLGQPSVEPPRFYEYVPVAPDPVQDVPTGRRTENLNPFQVAERDLSLDAGAEQTLPTDPNVMNLDAIRARVNASMIPSEPSQNLGYSGQEAA